MSKQMMVQSFIMFCFFFINHFLKTSLVWFHSFPSFLSCLFLFFCLLWLFFIGFFAHTCSRKYAFVFAFCLILFFLVFFHFLLMLVFIFISFAISLYNSWIYTLEYRHIRIRWYIHTYIVCMYIVCIL